MNISGNFTSQSNYNKLKKLNKKLEKNFEKLSSGSKINQAADDAAGMAISEKMQSQIQGSEKALQNINDGLSMLQTADSGLQGMLNYAQRMRELAVQAANGTLTEQDRSQLNKEFQELKAGVGDIAENTEFGNSEIKLLRPPLQDPPPPPPSGKVDIVFAVDNTGSMASIQQKVKSNLSNFINSIKSTGVNDIRLGLVEYTNDSSGNIEINELTFSGNQWTTNINDIENGLQDLSENNRGGKENLMTALEQVANNYSFRDNENNTQVKNIVFVTDENADDQSKADNTVNILQNKDIVTHGIYNYNENNQAIEKVLNSTNGQGVNINSSDWGDDLNLKIGQTIGESGLVDESGDMPVLNIQTGPNSNQNLKLELEDMRNLKTGLKFLDIQSQNKAKNTISEMDKIISKISDVCSKYGAYQNQLKHCQKNVSNYKENINAANSRIKDLDIAKEITNMTRTQILQQASQAMLAHSKSIDSNILDLFS